MNRGVITISESGTVSMPTDTVWMTMQEIADMYNVFGCYVRKAVKAIFKDGILKEPGVRRHVSFGDYLSPSSAVRVAETIYRYFDTRGQQCFARVYRDKKEFAHIVGDSTSVITRYKSYNDVPDVLP